MQLLKATGTREGDEEEGETSLQSSPKAAVQHQISGRDETVKALALALASTGSGGKPETDSNTSQTSPTLTLCFFQLSNEMQLSIMQKVKSGELSIEDALDQARKDGMQLLKQQSQAEEVTFQPSTGALPSFCLRTS